MALLCLTCHAGSSNLAPAIALHGGDDLRVSLYDNRDCLSTNNDRKLSASTQGQSSISNKSNDSNYKSSLNILSCDERLCSDSTEVTRNDTLYISRINLKNSGHEMDQYRQILIKFLEDPSRSGVYTLGTDAYTTAVLFFIQKLELLDGTQEDEPTFDEDQLSAKLIFDNGIWEVPLSDKGHSNAFTGTRRPPTTSEIFFILLGYIVFLLPRCGRSEQLIQNCEQETFLTSTRMTTLFPLRTALAREAIQEYLSRVVSDSIPQDDLKTHKSA